MWTVTELVFWNEQAMYIRGLKVSSAQRSASSALGVLEVGGDCLRVEAEGAQVSRAGTAACSVAGVAI